MAHVVHHHHVDTFELSPGVYWAGGIVLEPVWKVLESLESVVILSVASESTSGGCCHVDPGSAHPACAA
jgi:hypothetical protein